MQFVLASQSPARLAVLRAAGVEPTVRVSGVDEDAVAAALTDPAPEQLVTALAEAKAQAVLTDVATEFPEALVVACDSMLHIDGEMVGKPQSAEVARQRWRRMAGRTGHLLTGHVVVRTSDGEVVATASGTETTTVHFADPTPAEVDAYVATGEPLHVAGSFTLDGLGGWFVRGIEGDPSSVVGISLPLTRRLLGRVGVSVTDLWQPPPSS
ncbi:Maf family protein [Actinokineospora bangkokensis]|uniref:Nucleoside triphosphate pyrophosphatase n=1 Tax=Actinokineospora bangkokensis TaxID=1193682 RepID=A0A1Q9LEL1_9PSEU|nr:nucleoside triphosphate pyrophosphatase [Actinokineospora bangkokensis]OLR90470.1 septum formation inhibitor Maf [Actinokineospora bangkokensis]